MAKTCVTEKTAQRQRWIENGLLELMQKDVYEKITVTELCCHRSLSRRSFYRYFRDLDDVLESLMEHTFQDLAMPNRVLDLEEVRKNLEFWIERRDLLDALRRSRLIDKLYEYTMWYTDPVTIDLYLSEEDLAMDIRREISLFVISGFISLVIAWHADGFRRTPEEMARIAWRMMFSPILKME